MPIVFRPSAYQRRCSPACANLQPCAQHPPQQRDTKTDAERKFYSSSKWTRKSRDHRRNEPLCRECAKHGIVRAAQMTDHITAIRDGGDPWNDSNLQSMCNPCHAAKRQGERTK